MTILIRETWINATEGYCIGDSGEWYEPYISYRGNRTLFSTLQKEHGKCVGKMYVDLSNGMTRHIGWVFQKRRAYETRWNQREGADGYYIAETWVEFKDTEYYEGC